MMFYLLGYGLFCSIVTGYFYYSSKKAPMDPEEQDDNE